MQVTIGKVDSSNKRQIRKKIVTTKKDGQLIKKTVIVTERAIHLVLSVINTSAETETVTS